MDEELEGEQIGRLSESSRRYQAHSIFISFEPLTMPTAVTSINNTPKKCMYPTMYMEDGKGKKEK